MPKTAIMWIRDGVLIERMHINAVAFAYAVWLSARPEDRTKTSIERLINFAFEKSGLSCAEKILLYNSQCDEIVSSVEIAIQRYNLIAAEAANKANYFDGTISLLKDLKSEGSDNFITSALEQEVLDRWLGTAQGGEIAGCLDAVLGKIGEFSKGYAHFKHVADLGYQKIYYVADAIFEIATGAKYAQEFNLVPIGFGNGITVPTVIDGVERVTAALRICAKEVGWSAEDQELCIQAKPSHQLDSSKIKLADKKTHLTSLSAAGAEIVIAGAKSELMPNLRQYFETQHLLRVD